MARPRVQDRKVNQMCAKVLSEHPDISSIQDAKKREVIFTEAISKVLGKDLINVVKAEYLFAIRQRLGPDRLQDNKEVQRGAEWQALRFGEGSKNN